MAAAVNTNGGRSKRHSSSATRSGGAEKIKVADFTGPELYRRLTPFILKEDQLKENKFPRPDRNDDECAVFFGGDDTDDTGNEKVCRRCGETFEVDRKGKYLDEEECVYHWRKPVKKKDGETVYFCCSGDEFNEGCEVAEAHVHDSNRKQDLSGYIKTKPISPPEDDDFGVFAVDCEMVYTTMGLELAKVTVMEADYKVAYDTLVLPDNPIVDFNTRFSGIDEDDMKDVQTSIRDVQAKLTSLFNDKTILIGHSLESDLTSLKLIHNTVVDTSVVFPDKRGRPYKRSLRSLMYFFFKKTIQDDEAGHDSQEDARSCIQLMQHKLKQVAKKDAHRAKYTWRRHRGKSAINEP